SLRPETRNLLESRLKRRVAHIASSLGARARVTYRRGYPVTVNSPEATDLALRGLAEEFGSSRLLELGGPLMGAEDFSRYLERVPGVFLFLGVGLPGRAASLHSAS